MKTILKLKEDSAKLLSRYSSWIHLLATLFVLVCAYWNIEAELLFEHTLFLIPAIFLPGLAILISLKGLHIEMPYILGVSFAFGFILQNLNFFFLSLTHNAHYYTATISLIFIFSIYFIFVMRENISDCIRSSSFDFWNLTFYAGLALGLSLARIKFIGPFDESITGYAWSPILERHGHIYSAYSLSNASDFPHSYYDPGGKSGHVPHPPMLGSILAMLNPNGRFPLYFSQFQCFLLGFYSIACMLAACCTQIFNRYVAVLASVIYIVYLSPNYFFPGFTYTTNFFLYFPQHIVLLASLAFLLTTLVQNKQNHESSTAYFL